jgi:hypothetical protein
MPAYLATARLVLAKPTLCTEASRHLGYSRACYSFSFKILIRQAQLNMQSNASSMRFITSK